MSQELTPEQMRVMIGKALNWKLGTVTEYQSELYGTPMSTKAWHPPDNREWEDLDLPDFCADLNAMAQAEETLTEAEINAYERELASAIRGSALTPGPAYKLWHAKASARATAFCRVLQTRKGE